LFEKKLCRLVLVRKLKDNFFGCNNLKIKHLVELLSIWSEGSCSF